MSERTFNEPATAGDDPYHGWPGPDPEALPPNRPRGAAAQSGPTIESAASLQRMTFPPIGYVVPGYIAEGCTLLAGRPKLGKSWLVLESGLAVALGGDCLGGIACEQGEVLYLALEDNRRRLQRRIDKVLGVFQQDWPDAFEYATEWPRANEGGLDKIREWIVSKTNPRLVIVDVLAMFKPVRGSSESLYEADYGAIKGLQGLAGEFGIAIVVVHHTRKSGVENDPFEKVSGTLGLSGAADTTLILDRDSNGATLYGRGRDIEEIETAVIFDKAGCRWHVQGDAADVRRTDERSAVLAVLEDADEPMSPTDLSAATRMTSLNIRQLLFKMAKAGEVVKIGRGLYQHPDRVRPDNIHTPRNIDNKVTSASDDEPVTGETVVAAPAEKPALSPPADNKITTPSAILRLSIPARDMLVWLQSRTDQPVNAKLIPSHAPRHTRTPELRGTVLASLEEHGFVRIEKRTNAGARPSRFIHLIEGSAP